jgi:hypothetical protein
MCLAAWLVGPLQVFSRSMRTIDPGCAVPRIDATRSASDDRLSASPPHSGPSCCDVCSTRRRGLLASIDPGRCSCPPHLDAATWLCPASAPWLVIQGSPRRARSGPVRRSASPLNVYVAWRRSMGHSVVATTSTAIEPSCSGASCSRMVFLAAELGVSQHCLPRTTRVRRPPPRLSFNVSPSSFCVPSGTSWTVFELATSATA